ncbi:MAG: PaaI family thioesterase [Pseudomonadales bacterium]|nr:PaaI family thioesterase [Pseudomonadales bacterium]
MTTESKYALIDGFEIVERESRKDMPTKVKEFRRLSKNIKSMIHLLPRADIPEEELSGIADQLRAIASRIEKFPQRDMVRARSKCSGGQASLEDIYGLFDFDPLVGRSNPMCPELEYKIIDETVHATGNLGIAYQGPPDRIHGGVIASMFDAVLSRAEQLTGSLGFTGKLTVRYLKPTPLLTDIHFVARTEKKSGRKTVVNGTLSVNGEVTAEASSLMITLNK